MKFRRLLAAGLIVLAAIQTAACGGSKEPVEDKRPTQIVGEAIDTPAKGDTAESGQTEVAENTEETVPAGTSGVTVTEQPMLPGQLPVKPEPHTNACDRECAFAAEFAIERFIDQVPDLTRIEDNTGEYASKVFLTALRRVTDVSYIGVDVEVAETGLTRIGEWEIYHVGDMADTATLLVSMEFHEYIPDRAIVYRDECGELHYYYITLSGEDNLPILSE